MARQCTRTRPLSFLVVVALLAALGVVGPPPPAAASTGAAASSSAAAAAAVSNGPPTVTRVDSSVSVTPDATGRVTIPYCPTSDPCAFASAPANVVVTGRGPTGGGPANLVAYGRTATGFTLRALDPAGNVITTAIQVWYHAASDLTPNEEVRTLAVTTDANGNATVGYASPRGVVPTAVVASGASPDGGPNIPVSLVVSARTATGFTVHARNQTGAAIASTAITLSYYAAWAARIDPGTGWVAANATTAVTTDANGYATVGFAQALPATPTGIVAVGVAPASGGSIAASLIAHSPTTTGFRVRVLNQTGGAVASQSVTLSYHAVAGTRSTTPLTLAPPALVRSNGAELAWTRAAGAGFGRYEVHRSTTWGFAPSPATLLGSSTDPDATSWQDSTAAASRTYYYKVVGDTTVSNQVTAATPAAGTATLALQPDADAGKATYLVQDRSTPAGCYDWYNYGAATNLRVGTAANGVVHRPLLAFDLRDIPAGASVSSATMTLWYPATNAPTNQAGREIKLRRVTRAWEEGKGTYPGQCDGSGADWNETQGGVHWTDGGGDMDGVSDFILPFKSRTTAGTDSFTVTSLVQEWVNGTAPNHGVLLRLNNEAIPTDSPYFDYYSDDAADSSLRPRLTVTYTDGSASVAPRVTVAAPGPGTTVRGNAVPLKAAAGDDRRVDQVDFLVDGAVVASDTAAPFETTWNSATVANGSRSLTVRATDDVGHATTSAAVTVTVDNTAAPTVSLTAPATGATCPAAPTVTGTVTVTATAADDQGVARVEFYADDDLIATDTAAPYQASWNTLDLLTTAFDGCHTLTAKAYDAGGQVTTSTAGTITVANTSGTRFKAAFDLNAPGPDDDALAMPPTVLDNEYATPVDPGGGTGGVSVMAMSSGLDSEPVDSTGSYPPPPPGQPPLQAASSFRADVTVTNTSVVAWKGGDLRLWYRWYNPDGVVLFEGQGSDFFPQTVQPGQSKLIPVLIQPPALPLGADRAQVRLRFDVFDTAGVGAQRWFSANGNRPADNPVLVNKRLRGALGLERFWQYDGEDAGAGMTTLANVANGNMLLRWSPLFAPGRGLATMVDLTYNSLEDHSDSPAGNNFSLSVSGLSRLGTPIDIHPNKADEITGNANKYVVVTDGDGTTHNFTAGVTGADGITRFTEPPGVNLYLRSIPTNPDSRRWALTRPDNITFYYDVDGFPTAVVDRNGNTLTFALEDTPSGDDPGGPKKRITHVTDAGGRNFTIDYWTRDEAKTAHVRGKIQRIADHTGSALDFDYYHDGNLLRLTQRGGTTATGAFLPDRSFVFTYTTSAGDGPAIPLAADRVNPDPKTASQSTRIFSVRDPRGNETTYDYYGPSEGAQVRWKLQNRTDREGHVTTYGYDPVNQVTTVTAPLSRITRYAYDTLGRVVRITDPLNHDTTVEWSTDNKVTKVTEPTLKFITWSYNPNGYTTSRTDQLGNRTELTYLDSRVDANDGGNHLSLLSTVISPKGVATPTIPGDFQRRFTYDSAGNPDRVTDPTNATTDYDFNLPGSANPGTVSAIHDANGNPPTTFPAYDPSGLPTEVRDPLGNITRFSYDADGLLRFIQDPNHANDTGADVRSYRAFFDYDSFHRLGRQSAPKSTATDRGKLIWSSVAFDPNDNVVRRVDPYFGSAADDGLGGAVSNATYDPTDRPVLLSDSDTSVDPAGERTALVYDDAGRLIKQTDSKGVLSSTVDDHTIQLAYDPLDRLIRQTTTGASATEKRVAHMCYDLAGDLRTITSPRAKLDSVTCPATGVAFTASYDYDAAHRMVASRDPLGHETRRSYDADSDVTTVERDITTGRVQRTTTGYDQADRPIQTAERFDGTTGRDVVTRVEYDPNGNRKRMITPRAVDAAGGGTPTNYVTSLDYDAVNRLVRMTLPFDGRDGTERQYLHRAYDANGNLAWASLPVTTASAGGVQDTARTRMSYFDNGLIATSDDPNNPKVRFDYTARGQQSARVPERRNAPGELDETRRMTWEYFNDGQLKTRSDQGGQPATYTYDANDDLLRAVDTAGVTDPSEAAVETEATYTGFDEVAKARHRKQGAATWRFTDYTYDENGNTTVRRENGEEDNAGTQTKAPRRFELTYDQDDWVTQQLDLGVDSACTDDTRTVNVFWGTGWERQRDLHRAGTGCTSDPATWPKKQTTTWEHFDNGKLKKLRTLANRGGTDVLTESHDVGYFDSSGAYINGNRTTDHYVLERTQGNTASTCRATSPCDAQYGYDARDKLIRHQQRATKETTYTLDEPSKLIGDTTIRAGSITTELKNGKATTRRYTSSQLTDLTVAGVTGKYWYDPLGNLDCVTLAAGSQADCSPSDGTTPSANLVADNAYDYLDRLASVRQYSGGTTHTDKADYTYDALDRTVKEVEDHAGTGNDRTTTFTYQGLSSLVTEEKQAGGTNPKTKTFSYDSYGHRLTMTDTDNATGNPTTYTYSRDVHGSMSQLIDDAGNVKASYGYDAYGGSDAPGSDLEALTTGDTNAQAPINPYRYSGRRMDSGTASSTTSSVPAGSGGYDMGARRYGPDMGGFLQADIFYGALADLGLALDPLTQNRYALAGSNPISFVEIDGHMLLAEGSGGGTASTSPSQPPARSPDYRSGDTCAERLDCTVDDFNRMPVTERQEFVREFQRRYGERYGFKGWFNNVDALVRMFKDNGEAKPGQWTSWVDSSILHGFERGMAIQEHRGGGDQGNPGAVKWARFFSHSQAHPYDSDEKRRLWGEGEQAATRYGYTVASQRGTKPDLSDLAIAGGGEAYRWGLRNQGEVRTAMTAAGWVLCGAKCAELGGEAAQDLLSPQRVGLSYYGGHVIHGGGTFVEGAAEVDPFKLGGGAWETVRYGSEGLGSAAKWVFEHL